jgi:hypothetical protein
MASTASALRSNGSWEENSGKKIGCSKKATIDTDDPLGRRL